MKTLYNFSSKADRTPQIINKIRLEAVARKAIREGRDLNSIASNLMADAYFQEKEEILGVKKAAQLARNTIKKAICKENHTV
ncbi:MAG: hypothetical protein ACFBSE_09420 [Prochloraceae cyanobacterium]